MIRPPRVVPEQLLETTHRRTASRHASQCLVFFGLLFCILFKCCFITVGIGSKITVFFVCVNSNRLTQLICLQRGLSRFRSGNLSPASLRACVIACNARTFFHHDTGMNKFQSGTPGHGQILKMEEMNCVFFFGNNFNLRGCAGVAATGSTRRDHMVKKCYCP